MSAGKSSAWLELGLPVALVVACALGAVFEGGVEARYGGPVVALAALVAGAIVLRGGVAAPSRAARLGLWGMAAIAAVQAIPIPGAVLGSLAPGQAGVLAKASAPPAGTEEAWTEALVRFDVEAAIGVAGSWAYDPLGTGGALPWHPITSAWPAHIAALAPWLAAWVVGLAGTVVARRSAGALAIANGLVLLGVAEALWGLGNREAGSTGLHERAQYLGSATGTFVNRGHFAALLVLAIGGGWGLAASLFPLLPGEVRRHRERRRRSSQPPGVLEASGDKLPRLALLAFAGGLLVVGLVASQARGPLVALGIAGLAVGGWTRWRRAETVHLGLGAALPVAGVLLASIALGPRAAVGRFASLLGQEASVEGRVGAWQAGLDAFLAAPVLGWGLGSWPDVHPVFEAGPHLFRFGHAHSEVVEWAVETGALGLVALVALLFAWLGGAAARLDRAEHDARTAIGIGLLAATLAVLLHGLGDFPLRAPGVLLPWALAVGTSIGALADVEAALPASRAWTRAAGLVAVLAAGFGALAAARDLRDPGTREERLAGLTALWSQGHPRERAEVLAWLARAEAEIEARPLDTWAHLAVAEAQARLAPGRDASTRAFRSEVALARARALVARDPRQQVAAAAVLARLQEALPTRDAYAERATALLVSAVHEDSWRAEAAFLVTAALPAASLDRVAAAAGPTPFDRSRVGYQLGRAWERRQELDRAVEAHGQAYLADATYGPPAFARGVIHRKRGELEEAEAWLRRFMESRERPGGMEGWALYFLGDLAGAEARLRRVVETEPRNAWAWTGLAEVAKQSGNRGDEREAWSRVVALSPTDANARRRLDAVSSGAP